MISERNAFSTYYDSLIKKDNGENKKREFNKKKNDIHIMITRHTEGKRFLVMKNMTYSHVSTKTCSLKVDFTRIRVLLFHEI